MSKKAKKSPVTVFKITPKTENEDAQIKELQVKKKILEEKLLLCKSSREQGYQKLMEAIARRVDVKNYKTNEESKMLSIIADFSNNTSQVQRNYNARLKELKNIKQEKDNKKALLNSKIDEIKAEHMTQMELRNKTSNEIKLNMDSLSAFFSSQLSDIQTNLQNQIDKISSKWETNFTEHMEKYKDHVKKFDVFKEN